MYPARNSSSTRARHSLPPGSKPTLIAAARTSTYGAGCPKICFRMCLNIPRASSLMSIPRSSRSMLRPPADDAPPPGGLRLDPEHPPPPSLPLPSLRSGPVPEVFPTRFRDGEGVVLMVGAGGPDVVLAHEVAFGIAQFRAARFQAQPTRHVGVSWVNTVGSCLCLLLDHRSQKQPGQQLQLYASDHYPSLPP